MEPFAPDLEPRAASGISLVSFVLRFVCDEPAAQAARPATHWYGVIRHVQSNAERRFTNWDEAVAFMAQYVSLTRDA
jgi:hypothetical protein